MKLTLFRSSKFSSDSFQKSKIIDKSRLPILFLSLGTLVLPALLAPLAPHESSKKILASSYFTAQAQQSSTTNSSAKSTKKVLKVGVLAKRGTDRALKNWQPLADYLSNSISEYSFEVKPLNDVEIYQAAKDGSVDFIIASSGMYVDFEADYGANRIATLKNLRLGSPYTVFGGVILTKADRNDINDLNDLKGKTFMGVSENSLGGWQMAWGVLKEQGINPEKHFKELSFGNTQDNVVKAILEGRVDAGTVRTDTLERMEAEGKIRLKNIKVINKQKDSTGQFPFAHSTPLYPEWPFAVTKGVPIEISEKVSAALLNMPRKSPAAQAAKSQGWTIPLNYRPVHELYLDLQIGPYEELGVITFASLLRRLWYIPVLALVGIATTIIYFQRRGLAQRRQSQAALNELNKSLEESNKTLEASAEEQRLAKEKLEYSICTLLEEVADATEGDLTVRANLDSMELSTVADLFNAIIDSLQDIAIEAKQSSGLVGSALKENESAVRQLAEQAIAEAEETRNTLLSVEEMSKSIQEVSQNASQAELITDDNYRTVIDSTKNMDRTVASIMELRSTVGDTAKKMKRLGESSQKISQAVSLIEEIALKTNILAINASVEAGRAGEYGQGFTIVAEQVGALAKQSASATRDIAEIVATIQAETQEVNRTMESGTSQVVETTNMIESTKQSLNQVLEKSSQVHELMESISKSTESQAQTSTDVTNLMEKIAQLSEKTSQSSAEIVESILETAAVASKLEATVGQFKVAE